MNSPAAAASGERGSYPHARREGGVRGILGQGALFSTSSVLVSLVAMGCSAVAARSLSSNEFGSFSFAKSLLVFLALVFEFGLCSSASRLIARAPRAEKRLVTGAALLAFVPVAVAFSLFVAAIAIPIDAGFHLHLAAALAITAPLAFGYPFRQQFALQLSRGLDRLHVYSVTTLAGQAAFLALLGIASAIRLHQSVTLVLLLQSIAFGAASLVAIAWLRPAFRGAVRLVPRLVEETRRWGFKVYVGRVLSIGTYNLDVLMLGAFAPARTVGYYALAGSIAGVSGLPVTGMMSALFPRLVAARRIERSWLVIAWAIGVSSVIGVWLLAHPFVTLVFSSRFSEAARLALPLTMAGALMGVTTVYSSYLSAQAMGREIRDAGFILTGSNIVLNFALIPPFGAWGAAWASVLALIANLAAHVVFYRRSLVRQSIG